MADIIRKKEKKNWFYSYNMIFEQPISEHAKIVYLYLCRCADSEGQAFPSYNTIAEKCSISRSTAIRAIKELKEAGLLSVEQRIEADGSLTSNLYTIHDEPQPTEVIQEVHHPSVTQTPPLVSHRYHPSVTQIPEGLPNEGLPNVNNNIADNSKKEKTAYAKESNAVKDDVVVKNGENTVRTDTNTKRLRQIKQKIEKITGTVVIEKVLEDFLNTEEAETRLNRAIEAYEEISQTSDVQNPVGFLLYLAQNNVQPPARRTVGKQLAFNQFEQHDWDPAQLETLWEPIG